MKSSALGAAGLKKQAAILIKQESARLGGVALARRSRARFAKPAAARLDGGNGSYRDASRIQPKSTPKSRK